MTHMRLTTALLAALMLGTVGACASTAKHESVGEYIDDAAITAGVKAALVKAPDLKASEINVESYKGVVQLSGFVGSAETVATAATVARTVKGVKSVRNDLRLK
ncbi:MAG: BON domain-containing protein [Massilia sp.]